MLSFMKLVQTTGKLAQSSQNKRIDPLTLAKNKVLDALKVQKGFVAPVAENKPLPKNEAGREASTWFSKQADGWWTSIRYGQLSIPIADGQADMLIGPKLEQVAAFYDAVAAAIANGELDGAIGKTGQARKTAA
jgi:hypothetical protein